MANCSTEASFKIYCKPEQAAIACEALNEFHRDTTEHADSVIHSGHTADLTHKNRIFQFCYQNHPDLTEQTTPDELEWAFCAEIESGGIWIHVDDSINTDHAAIFTQAVLHVFDLEQSVVIYASHTCDRPLIDAFGGHSVFVTKDTIRYDTSHDFVRAEEQAHKDNKNYYFCSLTEVNGEFEYQSKFLMACERKEDPDARLKHIFKTFRGAGSSEGEDFVWYPCGVAAKSPEYHAITPHEYQIMSQHLSTL